MANEFVANAADVIGVADVIRERAEVTDKLQWPEGWKAAIRGIKGGADINFEVVGGMVRPSDPKENTIWVETEHEITGWAFSADEPEEPADGMVWILTTLDRFASFNALKNKAVMVYPREAMQYFDGKWNSMKAESFAGGEWTPWILYLYKEGNEYEDVTGGWKAVNTKPASGYGNAITPTIERNTGSIKFVISSASTSGGGLCYMSNKIDLTPYDTLYVSMLQGWSGRKDVLVTKDASTMWESVTPRIRHSGLTAHIITLDISDIDEPRHIAIGLAYNNDQDANKVPVGMLIDKIWLE